MSAATAGDGFRKAVGELFEDPDAVDAVLLDSCAELLDRIEQARHEIRRHGVVYPAGELLRTNPAVNVERDSVRTRSPAFVLCGPRSSSLRVTSSRL
jgi:hypothetical protein